MILRYGPTTPNPSLPLKWPALHAVRPPVEPSYGVGCKNALLANSRELRDHEFESACAVLCLLEKLVLR